MENEPLMSKEAIERRKSILHIVAAYRLRITRLDEFLQRNNIANRGTSHRELTEILLDNTIPKTLFNSLKEMAEEELANLSEMKRAAALESAISLD